MMHKRDLIIAVIVALALESIIALLFVYAPSKPVVQLHAIPVLLLLLLDPSPGIADLLVFAIQVLIWICCCLGLLHLWRRSGLIQKRILLAAVFILLLVILGCAAGLRISGSSLQMLAETDCACGEYHSEVTGIILLNPFRDHAPEDAADDFLSGIRERKCSADIARDICDYGLIEARPVLEWKLKKRQDSDNIVSLFYLTRGGLRNNENGSARDVRGEAMVQARQIGRKWTIVSYGVYY